MTVVRTAFIALGSNLGDRDALLASATRAIARLPGTRVVGESAIYETAPMGPAEYAFLNAAIAVETTLDPEPLLDALLKIERDHGRVRDRKWGPRMLDLDLLMVLEQGEPVALGTESLELPHPGITSRDFVLAPLRDLAPELVFEGRPFAAWLDALADDARTITGRRVASLRSAG